MPEKQTHGDRVVLARRDLFQQVAVAHSIFAPFLSDQHHPRIESPGNYFHTAPRIQQIRLYVLEHLFAANKGLDVAMVAH